MHTKTLRSFSWVAIAGATLCLSGCAAPIKQSQQAALLSLPQAWQGTEPSTQTEAKQAPPPNPLHDTRKHSHTGDVQTIRARFAWLASFPDDALPRLIGDIMQTNHGLLANRLSTDVSALEHKSLGAKLWPSVSLAFTTDYNKELANDGKNERASARQYSTELNTTWELDLWGNNRQAAQASLYATLETSALVTALERSLAGQVTKRWLDVLRQQEQVGIAAARVNNLQDTLNTLSSQFALGLSEQIELDLAASELLQAQTEHLAAERELIEAQDRLQRMTGQPVTHIDTAHHTLPQWTTPKALTAPVAQLLQRPDLQATMLTLKRADALSEAAYWSRFPGLTLTADIGRRVTRISDFNDRLFDVTALSSQLLMPLFNAGQLKNKQKIQTLKAQQTALLFRESLVNAYRDVVLSVERGHSLHREYQTQQKALVAAQQASTTAQFAFQRGLISVLDYLEIRRNEISQQSREVDLRVGLLSNRVDLFLALGPDVTDSAPLNTSVEGNNS